MHLPFIQVTNEILDHAAVEIAAVLGEDELRMVGGLVRMFRWALGRVPDNELPSEHDTITGPAAAKLIARAAGYAGDPEQFVDACQTAQPPVLQRVDGGIRFRGLDRYDGAVTAAESRSERARQAANARWGLKPQNFSTSPASVEHAPSIAQASAEHCSSDAAPMLGDAKTQTQTQTHIPPPPPAAPTARKAEAAEAEDFSAMDDDELPDTPDGFWEWWRRARGHRFDDIADVRPAAWDRWHDAAREEVALENLRRAVLAYLDDDWARAKGAPAALFISGGVWRSRVPLPANSRRRAL